MNETINIIYRIMSAVISLGFIIKALTTKSKTEQLVASFIMLPFLLRTLGLK